MSEHYGTKRRKLTLAGLWILVGALWMANTIAWVYGWWDFDRYQMDLIALMVILSALEVIIYARQRWDLW